MSSEVIINSLSVMQYAHILTFGEAYVLLHSMYLVG